jgi:hypothetical protein
MNQNYIKIPDLKPGYLYQIRARNSRFGIWLPSKLGFMISREKFGYVYPFIEYHYDIGAPFGTVKPLEEIEQSPFTEEDLKYTTWDKGGVIYGGYDNETEVLSYLAKFKPLIHMINRENKENPYKTLCGAPFYDDYNDYHWKIEIVTCEKCKILYKEGVHD